ncbi:odorant receptor 2a-like [Ctenocephalides felis]|uniref:odorant receptor 2a-like n=1 Tax=Ctenocephalides felis TaxID=7515 RepID=UPI000E6E5BE7|nr:odorant receptor 2a-like [Ctenocephalides felis]
MALLSYYATPLIDLDARRLPFLAWYGVDHKKSPWYELFYIYQCVGVTINCLINVSMDTFPTLAMSAIVAQIEVLSYKLKQIGQEVVQEIKIQKCVIHHNFIQKLITDVEQIFSIPLLVQFLLSGVIICVIGFQLSMLSPTKDKVSFVMNLVYFFTFTLQIFLPCYFGNEISSKSALVSQSAFSSSWIETDSKIKKNMIIFMERSKRPLKIYAGKVFELSLGTFTMIINASYKYYAVLHHMQKRRT